jgi:hypothetical protein
MRLNNCSIAASYDTECPVVQGLIDGVETLLGAQSRHRRMPPPIRSTTTVSVGGCVFQSDVDDSRKITW